MTFVLREFNFYPYAAWAFYGVLVIFTPILFGNARRLFFLFIFSLIFESAFLLDIGFFVRPSHVLGVLLILAVGTGRGGFRFPASYGLLLIGFLLVAVFAIFLNLDLVGKADLGFSRATYVRPLIQLAQFTVLVLTMVAVVTMLERYDLFPATVRLIHCLSVGVALYAIWEIASIYLRLPFFNLNNDLPTYWYTGFVLPNGFFVFRPRATFYEPINFNNFQFLGIACSLMYREVTSRRGWWFWSLLALQLFAMVMALSRSTLLTLFAIIPLLLLLYPWRSEGTMVTHFFRNVIRYAGVCAAVIMVITFVTVSPGRLREMGMVGQVFYGRFKDIGQSHSILGRSEAIDNPARLLEEGRLAFGVGIGNEVNWRGYVGTFASMYNQLIVYSGVVGLSIMLCFVGSILLALFRNYRDRANGVRARRISLVYGIGLLGMLVQRLSLPGFLTDTHLWVAFAIGIFIAELRNVPRLSTHGQVRVEPPPYTAPAQTAS